MQRRLCSRNKKTVWFPSGPGIRSPSSFLRPTKRRKNRHPAQQCRLPQKSEISGEPTLHQRLPHRSFHRALRIGAATLRARPGEHPPTARFVRPANTVAQRIVAQGLFLERKSRNEGRGGTNCFARRVHETRWPAPFSRFAVHLRELRFRRSPSESTLQIRS